MEQTQLPSRKKRKPAITLNNISFTAAVCLSPWLYSIFPIWGLILPCYMLNVAAQGRAHAKPRGGLLHLGSSARGS